ncbi:hypothetical protein AWB82_01713 [Caballeronia glebae]|uniref:Uncharacterized protein n=1 Tax=Caballeronia glebae TaxID=1777143 RepID=A0A158A4E9_9BURK|nr:hypothetical protein [Caballeronia glebae]SAK52711.1 hypothetical protein AWB82_01713 [Caballeronia glebae]
MMRFDVPSDTTLLAAIGEVALRQEHLNYTLRMTIKTLARLDLGEALDATAYDGSSQLRERIKKLARQELREGVPLLKLQALLERCKRATEKRNDFIHSVWLKELDAESGRRHSGGASHAWPTVSELRDLAETLAALTLELNEARLEGYLHEAVTKKEK